MPSSRILTVVIVLLVAALLVSSLFAGYYLFQYQQAERNSNLYLSQLKTDTSTPITTNILLDFGNGTRAWYNNTVVQPGWNLYLATVVVTHGDLNDTWYPTYGEHLVNSIDGVQNTARNSWFIWTYNSTAAWQVSESGADELSTYPGATFAWAYCGITPAYGPTCTSP